MRTGTVYGAEWGRIFYMIKGPVYRTRVCDRICYMRTVTACGTEWGGS